MTTGVATSNRGSLIRAQLLAAAFIFAAYSAVVVLKNDPSFGIDGKVYLVGSRLLATGGNPYDAAAERAISRRLDPAGMQVGTADEVYINLPASLVAFLPFSFLSARLFSWLLLALNVACIPLIVALAANLFEIRLKSRELMLASVLAAVYPPVWRGAFVGQICMPVLAALLGGACALRARRWPAAVVLVPVWLVKASCTLPAVAMLFWAAPRRGRAAIAGGIGLFVLLNAVLAAHIGMHAVVRGLQQAVNVFQAGGANDPYGAGRGMRIDFAPPLSYWIPRERLSFATEATVLLMLLPLVLRAARVRTATPEMIVAALAATLLMTYHRLYDMCAVVPAALLLYGRYRIGEMRRTQLLLGALVASFVITGDHNLVSILAPNPPWLLDYLRPLATALIYAGILMLPPLSTEAVACETNPQSGGVMEGAAEAGAPAG